ncbi:MAG: hypothetical protein WKG06_24010 [Segetibacter sp.]
MTEQVELLRSNYQVWMSNWEKNTVWLIKGCVVSAVLLLENRSDSMSTKNVKYPN